MVIVGLLGLFRFFVWACDLVHSTIWCGGLVCCVGLVGIVVTWVRLSWWFVYGCFAARV